MKISRRNFIGSAGMAAGLGLAGGAEAMPQGDVSSIGKTPHIKFSINIELWWKQLEYPDRIRKAAELGFPAVEFWSTSNKDMPAIKAACDETGIVITNMSAGLGSINDPKNHPSLEANAEKGCKLAVEMNATHILCTGGNKIAGQSPQALHSHIITSLRAVAPIFEQYGRTLILEPLNTRVNHPKTCLTYSDDAVAICRAVDSPNITIAWDLYHQQISEGDLTGRIKEGWDQVGYIQLADHPGRNEPGTGEIDYPYVLKFIHDLGYRGYVGAECKPLDNDFIRAARRLAATDNW
jgi:hydroxypyruvate isomerase